MDILAQREPETRVTSITAPPPQLPPIPADFAHKDWGLSLGICALVGMKVWELITRYHKDDSDLNIKLVQSVLDTNKLLMQAVLEKKT